MSWGLGWKRPSEIFHLTLNYGTDEPLEIPNRSSSSSSTSTSSASSSVEQELGFRIELDWTAGDDEDQVALRLQSQLMVALPVPQDTVVLELREEEEGNVGVDMKVVQRREPIRAIMMSKTVGSGQQSDGIGVLTRLLRSNFASTSGVGDGVSTTSSCADHWKSVAVLSVCGCSLSVSFALIFNFFSCLFSLCLDGKKMLEKKGN